MSERGPAIRLDKWLWQARFCKTRGLAAEMVAAGTMRVNAQRVVKPATPLRVGDGLSFAQGSRVWVIRVLALGTRRGPAPEARMLYAEIDEPRPAPPPLEPDRQPVK